MNSKVNEYKTYTCCDFLDDLVELESCKACYETGQHHVCHRRLGDELGLVSVRQQKSIVVDLGDIGDRLAVIQNKLEISVCVREERRLPQVVTLGEFPEMQTVSSFEKFTNPHRELIANFAIANLPGLRIMFASSMSMPLSSLYKRMNRAFCSVVLQLAGHPVDSTFSFVIVSTKLLKR
jgi:hypothetical protein